MKPVYKTPVWVRFDFLVLTTRELLGDLPTAMIAFVLAVFRLIFVIARLKDFISVWVVSTNLQSNMKSVCLGGNIKIQKKAIKFRWFENFRPVAPLIHHG